jgi:hypothetical protein
MRGGGFEVTTDDILARLEKVRKGTRGWIARCPAHPDRTPSLSVAEGEKGVLLKCFAGCSVEDIAESIGVPVSSLFYGRRRRRQRTRDHPAKHQVNDWRREAATLENAAMALRLRGETVLDAATGIDASRWTDEDWDAATAAVASAYHDLEQAAALEADAYNTRQINLAREKERNGR